MMKRRIAIRNILTKDLLLLLAQANSMGANCIDIYYDISQQALFVAPVSDEKFDKRKKANDEKINLEEMDIEGSINEDI